VIYEIAFSAFIYGAFSFIFFYLFPPMIELRERVAKLEKA